MSSLCLLSVDDVYEQDGLAAECLMVHKIKPRLSAAQRLPSGSHVVEACWEYKFRAHGQVNAPPPLPPRALPPPLRPLPRGPPGPPPPGCGRPRGLRLQIPKQIRRARAAWSRVTINPHPRRAGRPDRTPPGTPSFPWVSPLRPGSWQRPSAPLSFLSHWVSAPDLSLHPASPSLCRISWGSRLSVCQSASPSLSSPSLPRPASPCLCVSLSNSLALPGLSVGLSASRGLPGSPSPPLSPLPALAATALQRDTSSL